MKATILSPSKVLISFASDQEQQLVEKLSKYKKTSVEFQYRKHLKNRRWQAYNYKEWKLHGDALQNDINHSVIFHEGDSLFLRPGFLPYLKEEGIEISIDNQISYPTPRPYPWNRQLTVTPYSYQKESVEKLINVKHGNVSLCTGAGKTLCLLMIAQKLGLKTIIITPAVTIFNEILERFEYHFGKNVVGAFGAGKKRLGKRFIVCVADSVANLKPGDVGYSEIASAEAILIDESHTLGASTLEKMCYGVLSDIPYRFFFSGTQTRGDGTLKLLQSIIGPTVHRLSTKEAIEGGYICDHEFKIVPVQSSNPNFLSPDALSMKRKHLLNNTNIAQFIGKLANTMYSAKQEQTLVLVDEIGQIAELIKYIKIPYIYAVGGGSKKELAELGLEKIDPSDAVEKFNKGEARVLIGTACISVGVNCYPAHHVVNWQGGSSEIKVKQGAVGRSVRKLKGSEFEHLHAPKERTVIYDFDVLNIPTIDYHLKERIKHYKDSGTNITRINVSKR